LLPKIGIIPTRLLRELIHPKEQLASGMLKRRVELVEKLLRLREWRTWSVSELKVKRPYPRQESIRLNPIVSLIGLPSLVVVSQHRGRINAYRYDLPAVRVARGAEEDKYGD